MTSDIKEKTWAMMDIIVPNPKYAVIWAGPLQPVIILTHPESAKAVLSTAGKSIS